MNNLNLDQFYRSLFPVFEDKFEAFYIIADFLTIYICAYCFIWLLRSIRGD